ncbi:MAG: hypothetical protein A2513_03415 [Sulfurimonas sp. RIFOXYD12_FULL_33_39]|uniref:hypothetical protein n=1 Tax=unclassified Sulfurimonas TaxID=2623549 RepID=UPI0008CB75AC|nr:MULTISPECIES: hypothetical protein [unclassified Sulfurimonas]OHE09191.1 MAG: hypothetical protein A2513_03415 [Sulfurimonas sp. RIFOXYD12_FULL_33_39]OHE13026.1 MAG: hypothetical protein A2530_05390 [Sulfurimonas sp. RIFOXYD2_FULL_34_21]
MYRNNMENMEDLSNLMELDMCVFKIDEEEKTSLNEISLSLNLHVHSLCSEIDKIVSLLRNCSESNILSFLSQEDSQATLTKSVKSVNNLAKAIISMLNLELLNSNILLKHSLSSALQEVKDISDIMEFIATTIEKLKLQAKDKSQDQTDFMISTKKICNIGHKITHEIDAVKSFAKSLFFDNSSSERMLYM